MRTSILLLITLTVLSGCYQQLTLEGFDKEKWTTHYESCDTYRLEIADHLVKNEDKLLGSTQNEIESLLGKAKEHELYERNQKFFHYRLTPPDTCDAYETLSFLSIRFNAIGRVNLVQVMLREAE